MARYAETLKNRVVAKLLPPESVHRECDRGQSDSVDIGKMA